MQKFFVIVLGVLSLATLAFVSYGCYVSIQNHRDFHATFGVDVPLFMSRDGRDERQEVVSNKLLTLWQDRAAYRTEKDHCGDDFKCAEVQHELILNTEAELYHASSLARKFYFDIWPMCEDGSDRAEQGCISR
jgi:hypothetical protein